MVFFVCISFFFFSFFPEVYCVKLIAIVHINPLQNFAIVLAVGSCFDCPDDPVLPVNDLSDSLLYFN